MTGTCIVGKERIRFDVVTPDRLLAASNAALREEIESVVSAAFRNLPEPDRSSYVNDFFTQPGYQLKRMGILFRNEANRLIAATIWDEGEFEYNRQLVKGLYFISFMIVPEYQGLGLGQFIAAKVLTDRTPDLLLVTCDQSSSLHVWIRLLEKGLVKGFEVYPRLSKRKEIMFLPLADIDFVVHAFSQIYRGVAEGHAQGLQSAINNLTVRMVRKGLHEPMYDFDPWRKDEKHDRIAASLGLTERDGVLAVIRKLPSAHPSKSSKAQLSRDHFEGQETNP